MKTLNEKFLETCEQFAEREAMRIKTADGWQRYSYGDIKDGALKVASWLGRQGFGHQNKAALIIENSPKWAMVYFGILLAGGVVVPLDTQARPQDIVKFLKDAHVQFVFLEHKLTVIASEASLYVKDIIVVNSPEEDIPYLSFERIVLTQAPLSVSALLMAEPDDTAALLYSSGTTASPKGVELSHKNFYANFCGLEKLNVCSWEDTFISILPLFHAYAFMATFIYPFFLGAKIIYPNSMKSEDIIQAMRENRVTVLVGVPELFNNINKSIQNKIQSLPSFARAVLELLADLGWLVKKVTKINILKVIYRSAHSRFGGSLRFMVSGGAKLDPEVATDLERIGFMILEGYGLTETAPIVSLNPLPKQKIGSVGKALDGVVVKIDQPDASGTGEIIIRGDNVMKGYYQKPVETAAVIKEGWFHSGDLGFIDKAGYLHISGRLKEVIVLSSGKNIFPDEVEEYYRESPFIKEAGVFMSSQENLRAVIVPNFDEFQKKGMINVYEKIKWDVENISKELPSYKRILGFVLTKEELPKTRLGKIKRFQLATIYQKEEKKETAPKNSQQPDSENTLYKNPIGRQVVDFLRKELKLNRVPQSTDHLELDFGIDSLTRVELISGLEQLFKIRMSEEAFAQVATVGELVAAVSNLMVEQTPQDIIEKSLKTSWAEILTVESDPQQFQQLDLDPGWLEHAFGYVVRRFIFLVFKIFGRIKIINQQHLPEQGPYIICCNHSSYLDAFAVICGLTDKVAMQTYFIGLKDIFLHPAVRWAMRLGRLIPIDASNELMKAMQSAAFLLKYNKIICIFPEGQRSIDGEVKVFKKGIGILAKELQVPVVPAAIDGTYQAWPRTAQFPRAHQMKIIFGQPISSKEFLSRQPRLEKMDEYEWLIRQIREEVIRLKQQISIPVPGHQQGLQSSEPDI